MFVLVLAIVVIVLTFPMILVVLSTKALQPAVHITRTYMMVTFFFSRAKTGDVLLIPQYKLVIKHPRSPRPRGTKK